MNLPSLGGGVWQRLFNRRESTAAAGAGQDLLVVRLGMSPAFHFFCRIFAREHHLKVVPDRRATDRRDRERPCPSTERRLTDRRRRALEGVVDFWVVRGDRTED
jgi:hypothetical protein